MTQALRVRKILEDEIVSGVLRPGDRLDEEEIARRCDVSRTPVREALLLLHAANLVERKPRMGTVVRAQTLKLLIQKLELFSGLEALAGGLAARRMRKSDFDLVDRRLAECEELAAGGDADLYYDANVALHRAIYGASYNEILVAEIERTGKGLMPYFRAQHHKPGWIEKTVVDHREIVAALHKRNGKLCSSLLGKHVHFDSDDFADMAMSLD